MRNSRFSSYIIHQTRYNVNYLIQARNVANGFQSLGNLHLFLPRATAITDYPYNVPADYKLASVNIYIDAVSGVNHTVSLNGISLGPTTANVRTQYSFVVQAGDIIRIKRDSGSSDPYHTGYIRKIL